MRKATENRHQEQQEIKQKMKDLTERVKEKMSFKAEKIENDFQDMFEKNVLKRQGMEEKKKKKAEEKGQYNDFMLEKKEEKLMGVH